MHIHKLLAPLWLLLGLLVSTSGCGGDIDKGSAEVAAFVPQALSSSSLITHVTVTISAEDMPSRTITLRKAGSTWSSTIGNIPAGTERTFVAEAFGDAATKLFEGRGTGVTITAGQTAAVAITLQEVNPRSPFDNAVPCVSALIASNSTVEPGGIITLQATAHDPNPGDTLSYTWTSSAGSVAAASSPSTTWTAPQEGGPVTLTLTVTDPHHASATLSLIVRVTAGRGGAAVDISFNMWPQVAHITASATTVTVGETTRVTVNATDDDGDALAYKWTAGCPGTWTDDTFRTASFTPSALPPGASCGNCPLTATVEDGRGGRTTGTLRICIGPQTIPGFPPQIETTAQTAPDTASGGAVGFSVTASDPQGSVMTFSWTASTGILSSPTNETTASQVTWTPPTCAPTNTPASITVTVTNALGLSTSTSFALNLEATCPAITSTFDSNSEDWLIAGDAQAGSAQPTYSSTGGNPGGYISARDNAAGGVWYFVAPSRFLSDVSGAYGQGLSFDLKQSSTSSQFNYMDVILVGGGLTLVYDTPYNPGLNWTPYQIQLSESAGWRKDSLSGSTPTQDEFKTVLRNLQKLWIRGEFVSGADTGSLDNVSLGATNQGSVDSSEDPATPTNRVGQMPTQRMAGEVTVERDRLFDEQPGGDHAASTHGDSAHHSELRGVRDGGEDTGRRTTGGGPAGL